MEGSGLRSRFFVFVVVFILLLAVVNARSIVEPHQRANNPMERRAMHKRAGTMKVAGSNLPDCSHACGSCSPCRLVVVSFVCSSIEEAESCPMAYKCMCHNKSYPVP